MTNGAHGVPLSRCDLTEIDNPVRLNAFCPQPPPGPGGVTAGLQDPIRADQQESAAELWSPNESFEMCCARASLTQALNATPPKSERPEPTPTGDQHGQAQAVLSGAASLSTTMPTDLPIQRHR